MRIIGGEFSGRQLKIPPHHITRPMTERCRETLFDILTQKQDLISDKIVLDGFCGSGSLGLESLSRGATQAVFMDKSHHAIDCLIHNVASLNLDKKPIILRRDLLRCGVPPLEVLAKCDLFFMSPPWGEAELYPKSLTKLASHNWLAPNALGVVDCDVHLEISIPSMFEVFHQKIVGDHRLMLVSYEG